MYFFHGPITVFRGEKNASLRISNGLSGPCNYTELEKTGYWPNRFNCFGLKTKNVILPLLEFNNSAIHAHKYKIILIASFNHY